MAISTTVTRVVFTLVAGLAMLNGCGTTGPDSDNVISITLVSTGQFGDQTLSVGRRSIRYVKQVPNYPEFDQDTTVSDSNFLDESLSTVNLPRVFQQSDQIDHGALALDAGLFILRIEYPHKDGGPSVEKVIQYTDAPASIQRMHQLLSTKLIELRGD